MLFRSDRKSTRLNSSHTLISYALPIRSEEHTSELQSHSHLVCRLLLEKKKNTTKVRSRLNMACCVRCVTIDTRRHFTVVSFTPPGLSPSVRPPFPLLFFFFFK